MCGLGVRTSVALLTVFVLASVLQCNGMTSFKRVCYYTSWSQYRPAGATFLPGNIDSDLCTHIIYSFYLFNEGSWDLRPDELNAGSLLSGLTALRSSNNELKIMIAVGGFSFGSTPFSNMVTTRANRAAFISSVLSTLSRYSLDGLDLDWEYPGTRGGTTEDKDNFVLLCQELKNAFEPYGYLLSAAVPAGFQNIYAGFNTESGKYLDFVNVMGYDYYGPWDSTTGHNAPLYPQPDDPNQRYTLTETLRIYNEELGIPKSKLIVGMPTYGHVWTLANPSQNGVGSPGTPGPATPLVAAPGVIAYFEVCSNTSFQRVFDNVALVPYAVFGPVWISYDDVVSLAIKTDLVINEGYGGVMFWSLDFDDFNNLCGGGRFTLINSVKNKLLEATVTASTSTTTPTPTTSTTTTTTTTTSTTTTTPSTTSTTTTTTTTTTTPTTMSNGEPTDDEDCDYYTDPSQANSRWWYYANPDDCGQYRFCFGEVICLGFMNCPPGTLWNHRALTCDHAGKVTCACAERND
ncbi:chitinase-like protein 4 [Haliotis asinina]|uniref:chitinase-like protein 4 n=1 Tax=Haliotis asinina TaxID=109174 RepID=UPI00353207C4